MMAERKYSKHFEKIFNFTRSICDVIGLDIIKKDYKFSWRTVCVFILINIGIGWCFYTIYYESIVMGNHKNLFKTGSIVGTAMQGYAKAITALQKRSTMRFLYEEIMEMYETYELKSLSYKRILKYSISLVKKLMATTLTIVTITCGGLVVIPAFALIVLKTRIEILPYQIPYVDYGTDVGFYVTSVTHIICVMVAGYGNFVSDSWLFVYVAHVPLMKNILKCKFDELDEILQANPRDSKKSAGRLHEIFKWHQKYNIFCATITDTFFWIICIQISTEFFGIACSIVCVFLNNWPLAPLYSVYLFATIYAYCSLGNLVESANDDITTMIYDCCWYNLTIPEQKMILIMLRESQRASGISIGGIAPLSLNTALQLTKTIYTFSMMLKEFFN